MTIDAQQFPITAIGRVIVMIVITVMNCQLAQVFAAELARATTTNPGVHFKRPGTVTLLPLCAASVSECDGTIKFSFRAFGRHSFYRLNG